jgi:hypothetical protein
MTAQTTARKTAEGVPMIGNPMKSKRPAILAAMAAIAALIGCAPTSVPILLTESPSAPEWEEKWTRYGAYYLTDELFVEASFLSNPFVTTPIGKYVVNKKLKILTREGVEQGTLKIPMYSKSIRKARLGAYDSLGAPMKLDTAAIMREYRKSGNLIFPNIVPGCLLEVHLEFNNQEPITVFEHWFSGEIPVAHGRLTFSNLDKYEYEFARYGHMTEAKTGREKPSDRLVYRTWDVRNARPRSRLDFQEEIDAAEPRVGAVLRRFQSMPVIEGWDKLGSRYEEAALKTSFYNSTKKLRLKVDELRKGKSTDDARAQAVFQWVQDNISYKNSRLTAINPDRIMASGQGNMWEITVVLREMFKHLGLRTDVLVTRPRSMGGFDAKFETPLQLAVPLVSVTVGERTLLAFPYSRGAALGEYPTDFSGLAALSLSHKDSTTIPEFASGASYSHSTYRLDLTGPDAGQNLDMELGGYLGFAVRSALLQEEKKEVKDVFQKHLTELGASNSLKSCKVTDQNARGRPIRANLVFTNPNQSVERKGEMQMKLSHLFPVHFASYDTSRATGFKNAQESVMRERVEAAKVPGRKIEARIPCVDTVNPLFKVTCRTEEDDARLVFTREVTLYKVRLGPAEMRVLHPQILELNRTGEARLILRSDAAAKPESADAGAARRNRKRD